MDGTQDLNEGSSERIITLTTDCGGSSAYVGAMKGVILWPEVRILANRIDGEVVSVDSFGNLITNITAEMLEGVPVDDSVVVQCDGHETLGIFTAYGDQPEMTLIALVGSSGLLEMAIVDDSATTMLAAGEGARVTVVW